MDNSDEKQNNIEIIEEVIEAEILDIEDADEKDKTLSNVKSLEVINLITFRPDDILFDTSKITQVSFNPSKQAPLYRGSLVRLAVERRGSKKLISTLATISFDSEKLKRDGLSISGTSELTPFDRMVLDAINTLHVEGENNYITLNMIYHVMTGDHNKHVSTSYAREINNSITKLMYSHIIIKADDEAVMYPNLKDFVYDSNILPAERVTANINGTKVACIHIDRIPPLFDYASRKKQIYRVKLSLMQAPLKSEGRETLKYMTLVFYLLRRVISMRSLSNIIRYDTLYLDLGYEKETRKVKFGLRKRAKDILEGWINTTLGNVKVLGYEEIRENNMPYGLAITYELVTNTKVAKVVGRNTEGE